MRDDFFCPLRAADGGRDRNVEVLCDRHSGSSVSSLGSSL